MKLRISQALFAGAAFALSSISLVAQEADERPALPFPPGVSVESQCGEVDDLQDVELYDGTLGVSQDYVREFEQAVVQLQWVDDASISSRLPQYSPGNIPLKRWCTGTLISDQLVITAGHCFRPKPGSDGWVTPFTMRGGQAEFAPSDVLATLFVVNFGYQVNADTGAVRAPDVYPVTKLLEMERGGLDYAIFEVGRNAAGKLPGEVRTPTRVNIDGASANELLGIIQHPQGEPKKIEAGKLLAAGGDLLLYDDIDTWGGSSGSGILNEAGELVGVHTNGGCESLANRGVDIRAIAAVSDQM